MVRARMAHAKARYTGACRIADEEWDGYVVFQAEHRATDGTPASNADWLVRQIDLEMAKFEDVQRGLKCPDYYVIASNVRLSAASANAAGKGQGGIDKVNEHLGEWARKLGFKGFHVWHADVLASLLDAHPGVRTTFDFWVQPGDVLAGLLRRLSGPDQTETLTKYLRDSLRYAREIKTRDIGQAIGRTVTLDEVFIDLPVIKDTDGAFARSVPQDLYQSRAKEKTS